jgi:tRNA(Ile)-lysidine synthase
MILERFLKSIKINRLLNRGDRVLLAVSGGADSTAMLHLFAWIQKQFSLELIIGHLNHGLRGRESNNDEDFVRELGRTLQMPVIAERLSPENKIPEVGNLEDWARQQRYEFLTSAAKSCRAARIALGHTLNDQAETVLMRLIRGSGPQGLAAMPAIREGCFIRPMLWIKREEILAYLHANQFSWREDLSNQDLRFLRNRVRAELIPQLEEKYNPSIVQLLAQTAANLRGEVEILSELLESIVQREASTHGSQVSWKIPDLLKYSSTTRRQLIRHSMKRLKGESGFISYQMADSALELTMPAMSGKSINLGQLRVKRDFDVLVIELLEREHGQPPDYDYTLEIPGEVRIDEIGSLFRAYLESGMEKPGWLNRWELMLTPKELSTGLHIRNWGCGDRYHPTGSSNVKKVKELFSRKKISRGMRRLWPVVTLNDNIVFMKDFPLAADMMAGANPERTARVIIEERKTDA